MPARHSYADVAAILADQVDSLVPRCLASARRSSCGKYWECGGLDGRPGGKSWQLIVNRQRVGKYDRGHWKDFASGDYGDALDLAAQTLCGGQLQRAYEWACDFLGIDGGKDLTAEERQALARQRREEAAARSAAAAAHERRTEAAAKALWLSGQIDLEGSPVDRYLLGRGIDVRRLTPRPHALRYHPEVWCQEAGTKLPAMLAAVSRPCEGGHRIIGCHRTYLDKMTGGNHWGKANLDQPKKLLGRGRGGLIPLNRGASGLGWSRMRQLEPCAIGEGIEDTLSAAIESPDLRAGCGISLTNMGSLDQGWHFSEVILLGQNDPPESAAAKAQARTIERLANNGWRVRLASPPDGVKDWNDWLRQQQEVAA